MNSPTHSRRGVCVMEFQPAAVQEVALYHLTPTVDVISGQKWQ